MSKENQILLAIDAAKELGVTSQSVRNYVKRKLLRERKTPSGFRYFLKDEIERFKQKQLKAEETG